MERQSITFCNRMCARNQLSAIKRLYIIAFRCLIYTLTRFVDSVPGQTPL